MTAEKSDEPLLWVRVLSLALALLLWLSVLLERPGEAKYQVPVLLEALPSGLLLASPPPGKLEVTVAGPRILLIGLRMRGINGRLDLAGAAAGPASYPALDLSYGLERELKVVRAYPATVRLNLGKDASK